VEFCKSIIIVFSGKCHSQCSREKRDDIVRVLMVHHYGQIGGGTNSCFDICRMLIEEGHDVTLIIPKPSNAVIALSGRIGVKLISASVKAVCLSCHNADSGLAKAMTKFVLSTRFLGYWKQLFQKEQPDLIMFNSSIQGPLVRLAHQLGIKTVCFIRETAKEKSVRFWKEANKKLLSTADVLVFLTNYDIKSWGIPSKGKQLVIPDIVDKKRFNLNAVQNDSPASEKKYLLYLGGLNEEKGALDLLRAFRICAQKNEKLHLIILGDTKGMPFKNLGTVHKLLRRRAIKYYETCKNELSCIEQQYGRILDVGLVSDVSPWYKQADAIIFPVKKVHQARPVFEAGVFRKPVIIPDYPNFQDNVIDGFNGLFYRKNCVEDMAKKILYLFDSEDLLQEMGNNNYDVYFKEHTYQVAKERLHNLIQDVAEIGSL